MDDQIKVYIHEYMEKIFYFSLKKTGNETEAEDLTQDISLCILAELKKDVIPVNFPAWVWKIAKNRYSKWADNKHKRNHYVSGTDIGEFEIADEASTENEIAHKETLSLLRRELAFITSDYRNILIAFYLEDKKAKDIATDLNLPEGTVRNKLFRARNILKEGMNMAREFGVKSYKPEDLNFIFNGLHGKNNEPWCYLSKSLCKNIMLEAYGCPSTIDELAMEVGVALPYMEEEVNELVSATLMKKIGSKYETDFVIVSKKTQEKIYKHLYSISSALTEAIIKSADFEKEYLNCLGGKQPEEDRRWALLMSETDSIGSYASDFNKTPAYDLSKYPLGPWGHTLRPNSGEWDILGMETYNGKSPMYVSLYGCVSTSEEKDLPDIHFRHFTFQAFGQELFNQSLSYMDGQALVSVAKGEASKVEPSIINRLMKNGYISKVDNSFIPNFTVIYKERCQKMPPDIYDKWEQLRYKARDIAAEHYKFCRELIMKEIPNTLKDNAFQIDHACANIFGLRGAVVEEALRIGYLTVPQDYIRKKMIGAYLSI